MARPSSHSNGVRKAGSKTQRPSSPHKHPPKPEKKDPFRIKLKYVTSAVDLHGCPDDLKPEVALIGRSNSGKSSLLNGMANERIAKVSSAPGKTRMLNFFDAGPSYRLVDMPGYGWSSRGGDEHHGWKEMIESYLKSRENLCGLLLLMDVRRDWSIDEADMIEWTKNVELPIAVILTKTDKLSKNELTKRLQKIQRDSKVEKLFLTSALKKTGFEELEDYIFSAWVKPRLKR
jgi:GTP-binding protein